MADESYNVVGNAVLDVDLIEASTQGMPEIPSAPATLSLSAYPNPFSDFTTISYTLPSEGKVNLEISSILGKKMATLVNESQAAGEHSVKFDTQCPPPGVYTATLKLNSTNNQLTNTIKLITTR